MRNFFTRGAVLTGFVGLLIALFVTRSLWLLDGVPSFVDLNLPVTIEATLTSIARFSSFWDWYSGLGRPNPSPFAESVILALYLPLELAFTAVGGIKTLITLLVWCAFIATFLGLRRLGRTQTGALIGATVFVANPWFYDEVAQGHIYFLLVAPVLVALLFTWLSERAWSKRLWAACALGFTLLFAADLHYALVAGLAVIASASKLLPWEELKRRALAACVAAVAVLWIYVPFAQMLHELSSSNAPDAGSLAAFSKFTSFLAAIDLLRPNQNASLAVPSGGLPSTMWYLAAVALVAMLVAQIRRTAVGHERHTIIVWIAAGVVLGAGLNPPFGFVDALIVTHVPVLGDVFRDPTKAYVLVALALSWALSAMTVPAVPRAVETLRDISDRILHMPIAPVARVAAVAIYVLPFLMTPFASAFSIDDQHMRASIDRVGAAETIARAHNARFTMIPSGVLATYLPGRAPIYDPFVLFPTIPNVRIPVDYDFDRASFAARYGLAFAETARVASPADLFRDLGIAAVGTNDVIGARFDRSEEESLFAEAPKIFPTIPGILTTGYVAEVPDVSLATSDTALTIVDRDRLLIDTARSFGFLGTNDLWAFTGDVPAGTGTEMIGSIDTPPSGLDIPAAAMQHDGRTWQPGALRWADAQATALRLPEPGVVAEGSATGVLAPPMLAAGTYNIYLHVLDGVQSDAYHVSVNGTMHDFVTAPRFGTTELGWYAAGRLTHAGGPIRLKIAASGAHVAFDCLRLSPVDSISVPGVRVSEMARANLESGLKPHVVWAPFSSSGTSLRFLFGNENAAASTVVFNGTLPARLYRVFAKGHFAGTRVRVTIGSVGCDLVSMRHSAISSCRIFGNGRVRVTVSGRGSASLDTLAVADVAFLRARIAHHPQPLEFEHDLSHLVVRTREPARFAALRVAATPLWAGSEVPAGRAFGYAFVFTHLPAQVTTLTFTPNRTAVYLRIVAMCVVLTLVLRLLPIRKRSPATAARIQQTN